MFSYSINGEPVISCETEQEALDQIDAYWRACGHQVQYIIWEHIASGLAYAGDGTLTPYSEE